MRIDTNHTITLKLFDNGGSNHTRYISLDKETSALVLGLLKAVTAIVEQRVESGG